MQSVRSPTSNSSSLQWMSLVGVIWLQSINGTNSNFPAYSSELKQLLSLSQLQLNNLALASDAGKLFGCVAGFAALYLPLWLVLIIGSSLGLVGYGIQFLFLTQQISSLSYFHIFILTVLAGNGICWINTVCYLVTIRNFPHHRQAAVGLTTSYLGLSAVVYAAVVGVMSFSPSKRAQNYMLLNSIFPVIVSLVTAPFMRSVEVEKCKRVENGFLVLFMMTIATGIYAVVISLRPGNNNNNNNNNNVDHIKSSSLSWINVVGVGVFLIVPILIPMAEYLGRVIIMGCNCFNNKKRRVCGVTTDVDDEAENQEIESNIVWAKSSNSNSNSNNDNESYNDEISDDNEKHMSVIEEIGVISMVKRLNFWLYFWIYICGATLGLVYINNLGQIAESRGYERTSSLVSLASAFVFFGRLFPSLLDYVYSRSIVPGPASIVAAMIPMAGSFFLLNYGSNMSLHVSTAIIGFSTGIITAISVSTTTELFGTENFGVNHNVVVANIPLGSFIFGGLAALVYRKQGDEHGRCMGLQCYNMTFVIWGSLCSFGAILALVLHFRTRKFYLQSSS